MKDEFGDTPDPQRGTWTLTAPDGRFWQGMTPLAALRAEQSERIPASIAVARIMAAAQDAAPQSPPSK